MKPEGNPCWCIFLALRIKERDQYRSSEKKRGTRKKQKGVRINERKKGKKGKKRRGSKKGT